MNHIATIKLPHEEGEVYLLLIFQVKSRFFATILVFLNRIVIANLGRRAMLNRIVIFITNLSNLIFY